MQSRDGATVATVEGIKAGERGRVLPRVLLLVRQQPLGVAGGVVLLLMIVAAIFASWIAPYDPLAMSFGDLLSPPSPKYWLGTDQYGRDLFSRIIYGSRISLSVGLLSVGIGVFLGSIFGLISGYWGGTMIDTLIQRLMDTLMALPRLVLAIAMMAVLGVSVQNVMFAIGIVLIPRNSRVVRGAVISTRENQYVEAARAIGCHDARIVLRHILPNVMAPIIILASVELGAAIMTEASLSFLGYGTPPPAPSWGGMLSGEGRTYMESAPWIGIFPGLALSLAILAFNLFGDSVRDVLDPRLRGQ